MRVLLILFCLMMTLNVFSAGLIKTVIHNLAPGELSDSYELIADQQFDEIRLDCSSFLNYLHIRKEDQMLSVYLDHSECYFLAEEAYHAGQQAKPFCLEVNQLNPPFKISNDLKNCYSN